MGCALGLQLPQRQCQILGEVSKQQGRTARRGLGQEGEGCEVGVGLAGRYRRVSLDLDLAAGRAGRVRALAGEVGDRGERGPDLRVDDGWRPLGLLGE
jgi:hypothetical protein